MRRPTRGVAAAVTLRLTRQEAAEAAADADDLPTKRRQSWEVKGGAKSAALLIAFGNVAPLNRFLTSA